MADVTTNSAHVLVRGWITEVLRTNEAVLAIALRQRAKFEGWLKFELAAHASRAGASSVLVEPPAGDALSDGRARADLTFVVDAVRYDLELKTPNCNWRIDGVDVCTRPITKNIADIVIDGRKLAAHSTSGLLAFVLFPVPVGDLRWRVYIDRIAQELAIPIDAASHTSQLSIAISPAHNADVVVCCVQVPTSSLVPSLQAEP